MTTTAPSIPQPTIAFIGLGVMGYPMAGHLAAKGFAVRVYNRNPEKSAAWAARHAGSAHATPREAAQGAAVVCMCVGNDDDLRSVVMGENGALAGMAAGSVMMDHTTASATVARELHALAAVQGVGFVDAPVSGGQAGAVNGALTVMCGGSEADFARALACPVAARSPAGLVDAVAHGGVLVVGGRTAARVAHAA